MGINYNLVCDLCQLVYTNNEDLYYDDIDNIIYHVDEINKKVKCLCNNCYLKQLKKEIVLIKTTDKNFIYLCDKERLNKKFKTDNYHILEEYRTIYEAMNLISIDFLRDHDSMYYFAVNGFIQISNEDKIKNYYE
jgi:hypothetical protein